VQPIGLQTGHDPLLGLIYCPLFAVCCLFRSRKSSSVSQSCSSLTGRERRQNFVRNLPLKQRSRLTRLKKEEVESDNTTAVAKPKQVLRVAQCRMPGRPRGYPIHQRVLRLSRAAGNSAIHSASSSEISVEKADEVRKVDTEQRLLSETESTEDLKSRHITNGNHDYCQTLNDDLLPERWTANGMVFGARRLDLVNHTFAKSDSESLAGDWESAGSGLSCDVVNGANLSHTRDFFLSWIETDHAYAKRPPTPENLYTSTQCVADSGNDVLARLTVLKPGSSRQTRSNFHNCNTAPPPIQKCTVTLNKLSDSVFEPRSKIRLQLRNLEPQKVEERHLEPQKVEERHSAVEGNDEGNKMLSVDGCHPPISDVRSLMNASQVVDVSDSDLVQPTNLTFGEGQGCGGWDPMRSHDSGLELLASVSSLTDDRLQAVPQSENRSSGDVPYHTESETGRHQPSDSTSAASGRRRVKVFCVRKRCLPDDDFVSEETTRLELLHVLRDYFAKGSSGPECGTVPSRSLGLALRRHDVACNRRSEEIASNSVMFMHSSCSPLQNGVTEQA